MRPWRSCRPADRGKLRSRAPFADQPTEGREESRSSGQRPNSIISGSYPDCPLPNVNVSDGGFRPGFAATARNQTGSSG
jgi:hypothetical protein